MSNKQIYFLEGNIGAGKSTFLKSLDKNKFNIIDEPIEKFCCLGKFNPLDLFYKKQISSFQLFTYIITLFIDILLNKIDNNKINIICRNVFSTVFCFGQLSKLNNEMNDFEYEVLLEFAKIYKSLLQNYKVTIIYLKVNPEICFKRLKERNRKEENNVQFDYINKLNIIYENYIYNTLSYPKIILNGLKNTNNIKEDFLKEL